MIVAHAQQSYIRLGNVSLSGNGIDNSKELVPALVRRILGFNRVKYSVDRKPEPVQKIHTGHIIGSMYGTA